MDFGQRASLLGHTDTVTSVSFSPDGKYVVSGSGDNSVKIWSTESGEVVRTLNGHTNNVTSVSFSPDGKYVVSGSEDNSVKIWSTESGEVVRTLNGHTSVVRSVSFSPDGKYVVSGSGDKCVKIWSTESGEVVRTLNGHTSTVTSVSFSPDGKYVVESVKIWSTETFELQGPEVPIPAAMKSNRVFEGMTVSSAGNSVLLKIKNDALLVFNLGEPVLSCKKGLLKDAEISLNSRKLLEQLGGSSFS